MLHIHKVVCCIKIPDSILTLAALTTYISSALHPLLGTIAKIPEMLTAYSIKDFSCREYGIGIALVVAIILEAVIDVHSESVLPDADITVLSINLMLV